MSFVYKELVLMIYQIALDAKNVFIRSCSVLVLQICYVEDKKLDTS